MTRVLCSECGYLREREEVVYNLNATVFGMRTLQDSLRAGFVTAERLDGANMYRCGGACAPRKTVAYTRASLAHLPPILTVAMNRHVTHAICCVAHAALRAVARVDCAAALSPRRISRSCLP